MNRERLGASRSQGRRGNNPSSKRFHVKTGQRLLGLHLLLSPVLFCRSCAEPFESVKIAWLMLTALALLGLGLNWLLEKWLLEGKRPRDINFRELSELQAANETAIEIDLR